jgi:IMP cyclohydrolase
MYVGRIVAIGCTRDGSLAAMYRVSSRSFPNRQAVLAGGRAAIVPKPGFERDVLRNPYIAYNCLRVVGSVAVATNGSQTDPIAEKILNGMDIRDAFVSVLHALDYEHDDFSTPRIAAAVDQVTESAVLGIVRHDALIVRSLQLEPGTAYYVCTYERNTPGQDCMDREFDAGSAADACDYVLGKGAFADLERPITAACALAMPDGTFDVAVKEAPLPEGS